MPSSQGPSTLVETLSPCESKTSITGVQDVDCPVAGARTGPCCQVAWAPEPWEDEVGLRNICGVQLQAETRRPQRQGLCLSGAWTRVDLPQGRTGFGACASAWVLHAPSDPGPTSCQHSARTGPLASGREGDVGTHRELLGDTCPPPLRAHLQAGY